MTQAQRMSPWSFGAALLAPAISLLLALGACSDGTPSSAALDAAQGGAKQPELRAVKLQLNWLPEPEFGGFYAEREKALFQSEGLEVELVPGGPGIPAPQLVASGKVEFAIVSGPQIVELAEQGGDLVALFAVYQGNPMGIMVHADSPYESLEALWTSNATVAMEQGLAEYQWLSRSFPGGSLRMVPWSGNLAQFAADRTLACQCFITAEPVSMELEGVATRVFRIGDSGFDPYNAVLATSRAFLEKHPRECAAMVRACAEGWRAYLDDPAPFNAIMSALNPGMSRAAMDRGAEIQRPLIENDETKRLGLGGMRYARWQELIAQLSDMGRIKSRPDPMTLFVWGDAAAK